jgi:hypothetical protein
MFTNYAPGPVGETVFRNLDGSRHTTNGADFGKAKASFLSAQKKRGHQITEEFVSVDRVQYIGEKKSKLVVGVRRASNKTLSAYYDTNPQFVERLIDNQWVQAYQPRASRLQRLPMRKRPDGKVEFLPIMPEEAHRLTVREFEQALISGAEIIESDEDHLAREIEDEYLPDSRIMLMNMGYGSDGRDPMALSHEEAYLHSVFMILGAKDDDPFFSLACELLCMEEQTPGMLASHFMGKGGLPCEQAHLVLNHVSNDDQQRDDGEQYLPFVVKAISEIPDADIESRADAKSVSRDNKRMLSKSHDAVDYHLQDVIGGYRAPW